MKPLPLKKLFIAIWLPLAVGLVLRLLYLWEYTSSPLFLSPSTDALYHQQWAHQIAHGQFFPDPGQPFFRAPLYPLFLGFLYWIGCNDVAAVIIQAIFSLLTIVLVARIADRFGGSTPAKIAAWITACYGPLLSYQLEFQLPVLTVPLFLLFTEWLLSAQSEENKYALPLASLTVGLLAITQANCLVLILPVLYLAVKGLLKARRKLLSALAIFIWMFPIIPVTYANWKYSHQFVPIATQGGVNFYLGNNNHADGAYAVHPELGADWQWKDARNAAIVEPRYSIGLVQNIQYYSYQISDNEADKIYWIRGFQFWKDSPVEAVELTIRKVGYLFHHFEIGNNRDLQRFWVDRPITKWLGSEWIFGLIAPIGIAGFLLLRKNKSVQYAAICGALLLLSYVPFFITARYRLPVSGLLIAGASALLYKIYHHEFSNRQILFPAIVGLVCVWHPFGAPPIDPSQYSFTKANAYLRLERYEEALPFYQEAISLHSTNPMVENNYGIALMNTGKLDEAEKWFQIAEKQANRDQQLFTARNNLGVLAEKRGQYQLAFTYFDKVNSEESHANSVNLSFLLLDSAMVKGDSLLLKQSIELFHQYVSPTDSSFSRLAGLILILLRHDFTGAQAYANEMKANGIKMTREERLFYFDANYRQSWFKRYDAALLILQKFGYPINDAPSDRIHTNAKRIF